MERCRSPNVEIGGGRWRQLQVEKDGFEGGEGRVRGRELEGESWRDVGEGKERGATEEKGREREREGTVGWSDRERERNESDRNK